MVFIRLKYIYLLFFLPFALYSSYPGEKGTTTFSKSITIDSLTKFVLMNGNNISVNIYNEGTISPGDGLIRNVNNFVWNGLGDFYTAGIVVGGEVLDTSKNVIHIINSSINDSYARERNPLNNAIHWEWKGLSGYDNPALNVIATNDNPSSWPAHWTSWRGLFGEGKVMADKEAYFVMDDRNNAEFDYFPFPDSTRRGLGIEVVSRLFQFSDANVEDVLFVHYAIKNVSSKDLGKIILGFYLDVDVGGASILENTDDLAFFNKSNNLVYYWDYDGKGYMNLPTHYSGAVHLATPGNAVDGIDNDGDGMSEESQSNEIDDDGDWDLTMHDVGSDGKPGTIDIGENDGIPTLGEPNYETLDIEEADEIGLSSFRSWAWSNIALHDDETAWGVLHHGINDTIPILTDIVSLFGSGDFSLRSGETTTYSLAFFCAWSLDSTITLGQKIVDEYAIKFSADGVGNKSIGVTITAPVKDQVVNNTSSITWNSSGVLQNRTMDIWYSNVVDVEWNILTKDIPDFGSYSWNTTSFRDGAFYKIRVVSKKNGNKGFAESEYFRINNSGNAQPEAYFTSSFKSIFKDTVTVSWISSDAEGSAISSKLYISTDNGIMYSLIDSFSSVTHHLLQTKKYPNSYSCFLKLESSDGTGTSETISPKFSILNIYKSIKDSMIIQTAGRGTGEIIPVVIDSTQLNGHLYEVTFDSLNAEIVYSVFDKTLAVLIIDKEPLPTILASGRYFDGMRLTIKNHPVEIDVARSGFTNNNSPGVNFTLLKPSVGVYRGAPLDVRFVFNSPDTNSYGKYVDPGDTLYSINLLKIVSTPFTVRFLDSAIVTQAMVYETFVNTKNNRWDWNEHIIVLTPSPYRMITSNTMLQITFKKMDGVPPSIKTGDIFIARMKKPFTSNDKFEFIASGNNLVPTGVLYSNTPPKEFSLSQNFPNPFNPATTIRFTLPRDENITIIIYDALGRKIRTLVDEERPPGDFEVRWNGKNDDNFPVASGLYYYRMVSGFFAQTKKMTVLK